MNYDVVVGVGCSFMNGDRIVDKDGVYVGKDLVAKQNRLSVSLDQSTEVPNWAKYYSFYVKVI